MLLCEQSQNSHTGLAKPVCEASTDLNHINPKLLRHRKHNILLPARHFLRLFPTQFLQAVNHLGHQHFRGGGTGGYAYGLLAFQPFGINLVGFVDQIGGGAHAFGQFPQAVGVGAVGGAHYQHDVAVAGQLFDGILPVLGGVADVVFAGAFYLRELGAQGVDYPGGVVHRQRGLGNEGQPAGVFYFQLLYVRFVFHQVDVAAVAVVVLAHGAFHFRMTVVADEDAFAAVAAVAHHFHMHLGDQRAGGVKHFQATAGGFVLNRLGHAMGAEDHQFVIRHFVQLVYKDGAALPQVAHHKLVVDHFVAHVNGSTEHVQRAVYDFYGAVYAGTEATGVSESDLHSQCVGPAGSTSIICTSNCSVCPASG